MSLVARKEEQKLLNQAVSKKESQFIAVYGRYRVGKTYLIREMFFNQFSFVHTGYYNLPGKGQLSGFFKSLQKSLTQFKPLMSETEKKFPCQRESAI